jgi:hypothetical protein
MVSIRKLARHEVWNGSQPGVEFERDRFLTVLFSGVSARFDLVLQK